MGEGGSPTRPCSRSLCIPTPVGRLCPALGKHAGHGEGCGACQSLRPARHPAERGVPRTCGHSGARSRWLQGCVRSVQAPGCPAGQRAAPRCRGDPVLGGAGVCLQSLPSPSGNEISLNEVLAAQGEECHFSENHYVIKASSTCFS